MRTNSHTATVLFTDIVRSTELMGRLGDAAHRVRARYFAALRNALAVHGGVEVKTVGDGMMAIFVSARDALDCAIAMQQDLAASDMRHPDAAFDQRIGVSLGELHEEGGDYYGTAVVEASRLCAVARPGEILVTDVVHLLVDGTFPMQRRGTMTLKGLSGRRVVWQLPWEQRTAGALRVALADDSVLLREGLARVLDMEGFDVVLQVSDPAGLHAGIAAARPHVAVLDLRMPPTHTTEGLSAALRLRREHPEIGVLILSQAITVGVARTLLDALPRGAGYLLKERVGHIDELVAAIRTVASGGRVVEPSILAALADSDDGPLELDA